MRGRQTTDNLILLQIAGRKQISLIDTGASVSAISHKLVEKLNIPMLAASRTQLLSAGSQVLPTLGRVEVTINLNGLLVPFEFIVIPQLCNDVILGMDFLNTTQALINVSASTVQFYGGLVVLNLLNHFSAINVARVVKQYILPPCSESAISVFVPRKVKQHRDDEYAIIVEPLPLASDQEFLVARSIANVTDKHAVIKVLNPLHVPVKLRNRQPIAQMEIIKIANIDTVPYFDNQDRLREIAARIDNKTVNLQNVNKIFRQNGKLRTNSDQSVNNIANVNRQCKIANEQLLTPKNIALMTAEANQNFESTVDIEPVFNTAPNDTSEPTSESIIDEPDFDDPYEVPLDPTILDDLKITLNDTLTVTQHNQLIRLLQKNESVFSKGMHDLPGIDFYQHVIDTGDHKPIRSQPYKHTLQDNLEIDRQVEELLRAGHIYPSTAIWASPVLLVTKHDNSKRLVIDYRKINQVISKISFPIALPTQIFDAVAENKAKYYTVLDMKSGYTQIPIAPESQDKTTFITANGQFGWRRCPFGLSTSGSIFVALVTNLFRNQAYQSCCVYVDDILIFSRTFSQHIIHLQNAFDTLTSVNLKLNAAKCTFGLREINYLGMTISERGIAINPAKTDIVRNYPVPRNVKQVRQFLGFTNFYRKFVRNYALIAQPLNVLLRKEAKFLWTRACQSAFEELRDALVKPPILAHPDMSKQFILTTDASKTAISFILSQADAQNRERVISYGGRALRDAELNFDVSQLECLALLTGIKENHAYLSHQHFIVYSDHSSLVYLRNIQNKNGRLYRWSLMLSEYSFTIKHKPGLVNVADALSRITYTPETPEQQKAAMNDDMYDKITIILPGVSDNTNRINPNLLGSVNVADRKYSNFDRTEIVDTDEPSAPDYVSIQRIRSNNDRIRHIG